MVLRHLDPIWLSVERFGYDDEALAHFAKIERVRIIILGETESKEVATIGERRGKAHSVVMAILIYEFAKRSKNVSCRLNWFDIQAGTHHRQEHCF